MPEMLTADEVIGRIHGSYLTGDKHGLQNTRALLTELGLEPRLPMIHVAGTNGKGSVCAML